VASRAARSRSSAVPARAAVASARTARRRSTLGVAASSAESAPALGGRGAGRRRRPRRPGGRPPPPRRRPARRRRRARAAPAVAGRPGSGRSAPEAIASIACWMRSFSFSCSRSASDPAASPASRATSEKASTWTTARCGSRSPEAGDEVLSQAALSEKEASHRRMNRSSSSAVAPGSTRILCTPSTNSGCAMESSRAWASRTGLPSRVREKVATPSSRAPNARGSR
jgi:hypothetical protein